MDTFKILLILNISVKGRGPGLESKLGQFCYDSFAVVTYITDYLSKADAGITAALKKALHESQGCNDLDRLNYMKNEFFTHRQCSVAEATYRLISGMNLKASNV